MSLKAKQKSQLRDKKKQKRANMKTEEVRIISEQIVFAFLEEFDLKNKQILIYLPQENSNEVDTWFLMDELLKQDNVELFIPVFDAETNTITPRKINDETTFYKGRFGIPAPEGIDQPDESTRLGIELDYIVIPLLGFDLNGNRLGHGNGSYDRFLKRQSSRSIKVGFAYEIQLVQKGIPAHKNDVGLDYCITEDSIYKF
ncbi:5-formyltetrahydrofolate cyclo-ligase [Candidatus Dojkabacteria bacterium]|nr:5-formyltetrahydrofolate cyclo-ligase [Candidatus Dojkabacteria bacterium]